MKNFILIHQRRPSPQKGLSANQLPVGGYIQEASTWETIGKLDHTSAQDRVELGYLENNRCAKIMSSHHLTALDRYCEIKRNREIERNEGRGAQRTGKGSRRRENREVVLMLCYLYHQFISLLTEHKQDHLLSVTTSHFHVGRGKDSMKV